MVVRELGVVSRYTGGRTSRKIVDWNGYVCLQSSNGCRPVIWISGWACVTVHAQVTHCCCRLGSYILRSSWKNSILTDSFVLSFRSCPNLWQECLQEQLTLQVFRMQVSLIQSQSPTISLLITQLPPLAPNVKISSLSSLPAHTGQSSVLGLDVPEHPTHRTAPPKSERA